MPSLEPAPVPQSANHIWFAGPWLQDETAFRLEVGRRLRTLRDRSDLTQGELAFRAGTSRNFVSAVERGTQRPDAWRLWHLAVALDVRLAVLACQEPLALHRGGARTD